MANYNLMIYYLNSVDKDIQTLQEQPGSKVFVKHLIQMQEYSKAQWAKIHSIVKSMQSCTPEEAFKKSQDIIAECFNMNMEINKVYDKITKLAIAKDKKGDHLFLQYLLEEMFYNYSIYLDALHYMGIYYITCQEFPYPMCDMFASRKMAELANKVDPEQDEPEP